MSRPLRLACLGALLIAGWLAPASANIHLEAIDELPVAEQYRQLSLMLLVTAGAGQGFAAAVESRLPASTEAGEPGFDPTDYTTPMVRIVDQETLLAGAAQLFRFARGNSGEVRTRLNRLETDYPFLISQLPTDAITADAIIVRNAIADAAEYSGLLAGTGLAGGIRSYREQTLYLRNVMEYEDFRAELARLTEQAIESVGGKLDAYQRMFDDETGSDTFDRHIEAAESIYTRRGEFDPKAGELTEEMIESWILSESQPNR